MYERIQVKQINDHIWLLDDNGDSTGYLVTGEKSGLPALFKSVPAPSVQGRGNAGHAAGRHAQPLFLQQAHGTDPRES